eukprot:6213642-Pleurochrysis_carterae.AAC.2
MVDETLCVRALCVSSVVDVAAVGRVSWRRLRSSIQPQAAPTPCHSQDNHLHAKLSPHATARFPLSLLVPCTLPSCATGVSAHSLRRESNPALRSDRDTFDIELPSRTLGRPYSALSCRRLRASDDPV